MKWEQGPNLGTPDDIKKKNDFGPREDIRAVLYDKGTKREVKSFLQGIIDDSDKVSILDSELSKMGEDINTLSRVPEEAVSLLEQLIAEKDMAVKREIAKKYADLANGLD